MLAIPERGVKLVELSKDLPTDWTSRELACVVSYYDANSGGCVLAFSGSIFGDKVLSQDLAKEGNCRLASNLLDFLMGDRLNRQRRAEFLCKEIERNLFCFIRDLLKSSVVSHK